MLIDALEQQGVFFDAFIPYMPGARQDRTDRKSPLTVKVMSRVLDLCNRDHVFDPHSDVLERIAPVQVWMPRHLPVPIRSGVAGIIAPDEGAVARASDFRNTFYPGKPVIICSKKRDFASGKFLGYEMPPLPGTGHYIVVDDICDGGGTFNLLALEFVKDPSGRAQATSLELFVSHGIFSKGLSAISPLYERITTTDSWCRMPDNPDDTEKRHRLRVIPLLPALKEHLGA
jgi:ribose-phosphate pyrophosphokinase